MSVLYCGLDDVKRAGRLNIDDLGDYVDVDINQMIGAASRLIDKYCNVPDDGFCVTADTTHYYTSESLRPWRGDGYYGNGTGSRLFFDMPCISITTLTDAGGQTFSPSQYRLGPYNYNPKRWVELLSMVTWSWNTDGRIRVIGKFGYATATPDAIREACATYAAWMYKRWQAALQDATANAELGQIIYGNEMPKQVKAILNLYSDYTKIL